jgi:hypothetical protein
MPRGYLVYIFLPPVTLAHSSISRSKSRKVCHPPPPPILWRLRSLDEAREVGTSYLAGSRRPLSLFLSQLLELYHIWPTSILLNPERSSKPCIISGLSRCSMVAGSSLEVHFPRSADVPVDHPRTRVRLHLRTVVFSRSASLAVRHCFHGPRPGVGVSLNARLSTAGLR